MTCPSNYDQDNNCLVYFMQPCAVIALVSSLECVVLYCIVLYCTFFFLAKSGRVSCTSLCDRLYGTAPHCTALYGTLRHSLLCTYCPVLHVLYCNVLQCTELRVLSSPVLFCAVVCCDVFPCGATEYRNALYTTTHISPPLLSFFINKFNLTP